MADVSVNLTSANEAAQAFGEQLSTETHTLTKVEAAADKQVTTAAAGKSACVSKKVIAIVAITTLVLAGVAAALAFTIFNNSENESASNSEPCTSDSQEIALCDENICAGNSICLSNYCNETDCCMDTIVVTSFDELKDALGSNERFITLQDTTDSQNEFLFTSTIKISSETVIVGSNFMENPLRTDKPINLFDVADCTGLHLFDLSVSRNGLLSTITGGHRAQIQNVVVEDAMCGNGWRDYPDGEKCIQLAPTELTASWTEAEAFCRSQGGTLLSLTDQAQASMVDAYCSNCGDVWIGGKVTNDGNVQFSTGEYADIGVAVFPYQTSPAAGDCVVLGSTITSLWEPASCDTEKRFLCEKKHGDEPSIYELLFDTLGQVKNTANYLISESYLSTKWMIDNAFGDTKDDVIVYATEQDAFFIPATAELQVVIEMPSDLMASIEICEIQAFDTSGNRLEWSNASQTNSDQNASFAIDGDNTTCSATLVATGNRWEANVIAPIHTTEKLDRIIITTAGSDLSGANITIDVLEVIQLSTSGPVYNIQLSINKYLIVASGTFDTNVPILLATDVSDPAYIEIGEDGTEAIIGLDELPRTIHYHRETTGASESIYFDSVAIYTYGGYRLTEINLPVMYTNCPHVRSDSAEANDQFVEYFINDNLGMSLDRDISFDFAYTGCPQLSLWTHPSLPVPYTIELIGAGTGVLEVLSNDQGLYDDNNKVTGAVNNQLPIRPRSEVPKTVQLISSTDDACIESIMIRHYGKEVITQNIANLTSPEISEQSRCEVVCPKFLDDTCVQFGTDTSDSVLQTLTIDLINQNCDAFTNGVTGVGEDTLTACSITETVSSDNDATSLQLLIADAAELYSSIALQVQSTDAATRRILNNAGEASNFDQAYENKSVLDFGGAEVYVPRGMKLILSPLEEFTQMVLENGGIVLETNAVLEIETANLNYSFSILSEEGEEILIEDSQIFGEVSHSGDSNATFSGCQIFTSLNVSGFTTIVYSELYSESKASIFNLSKLSLEGITIVHDEFLTPDSSNLDLIDRKETRAQYLLVNEALQTGQGSSNLSSTSTFNECTNLCEANVHNNCVGIWYEFDKLSVAQNCKLCMGENCESIIDEDDEYVGEYFQRIERLTLSVYQGCLASTIDRFTIDAIPDTTIQSCNVWCYYYRDCFSFTFDTSNNICQLHQTDSVSDDCAGKSETSVYLKPEPTELDIDVDYANVPTSLMTSKIVCEKESLYEATIDDCARFCDVHVSCDAFRFENGFCQLLFTSSDIIDSLEECPQGWIEASSANYTEVHVSLNNRFPNYEYSDIGLRCMPSESFEEQCTSKLSDCSTLCDISLACVGFAFAELDETAEESNCKLMLEDELDNVYVSGRCDTNFAEFKIFMSYFRYDFKLISEIIPGISSVDEDEFSLEDDCGDDAITINLTAIYNVASLDACKSACDELVGCLQFGYDAVNQTCWVAPPDIEADCTLDGVVMPGNTPPGCNTTDCFTHPTLELAAAKCLQLGEGNCSGIVQFNDTRFELRAIDELWEGSLGTNKVYLSSCFKKYASILPLDAFRDSDEADSRRLQDRDDFVKPEDCKVIQCGPFSGKCSDSDSCNGCEELGVEQRLFCEEKIGEKFYENGDLRYCFQAVREIQCVNPPEAKTEESIFKLVRHPVLPNYYRSVSRIGDPADDELSSKAYRFGELISEQFSVKLCDDHSQLISLQLVSGSVGRDFDYRIDVDGDGTITVFYHNQTAQYFGAQPGDTFQISFDDITKKIKYIWNEEVFQFEEIDVEHWFHVKQIAMFPQVILHERDSKVCDVELFGEVVPLTDTKELLQQRIKAGLQCTGENTKVYQRREEFSTEKEIQYSHTFGFEIVNETILEQQDIENDLTCRKMCDVHYQCVAFRYVQPSTLCILYSSISIPKLKENQNRNSDEIISVNISTVNWFRDIYTALPSGSCFLYDNHREDEDIFGLNNKAECRDRCFASLSCRGFSWNENEFECTLRARAAYKSTGCSGSELHYIETFDEFYIPVNETIFGNKPVAPLVKNISIDECEAFCTNHEECASIGYGSLAHSFESQTCAQHPVIRIEHPQVRVFSLFENSGDTVQRINLCDVDLRNDLGEKVELFNPSQADYDFEFNSNFGTQLTPPDRPLNDNIDTAYPWRGCTQIKCINEYTNRNPRPCYWEAQVPKEDLNSISRVTITTLEPVRRNILGALENGPENMEGVKVYLDGALIYTYPERAPLVVDCVKDQNKWKCYGVKWSFRECDQPFKENRNYFEYPFSLFSSNYTGTWYNYECLVENSPLDYCPGTTLGGFINDASKEYGSKFVIKHECVPDAEKDRFVFDELDASVIEEEEPDDIVDDDSNEIVNRSNLSSVAFGINEEAVLDVINADVFTRDETTLSETCILLGENHENNANFMASLPNRLCNQYGRRVEANTTTMTFYNAFEVYDFTSVQEVNGESICPKEDTILVTTTGLFDVTECEGLCESHIDCGSFLFSPDGTCALYDQGAFIEFDNDCNYLEENQAFFMTYQQFVDPTPSYAVHGSSESDLCLLGNETGVYSNVGTQYECMELCSEAENCGAASLNADNTCTLFSKDYSLETCIISPQPGQIYIQHSNPQFRPLSNMCISPENTGNSFTFPAKTKEECAGLCASWFDCRIYTLANDGTCTILDTTQYEDCGNIPNSTTGVTLFSHFSDSLYTRLEDKFCVASTKELATLEDVSLTGCETVCDNLEQCNSFEFDAAGNCILFESSDFSNPCEVGDRDLYISYNYLVADDRAKYSFHSPKGATCIRKEGERLQDTSSVPTKDVCRDACFKNRKCVAFEYSSNLETCSLLEADSPNGELLEEPVDYTNNCDGDSSITTELRATSNPYRNKNTAILKDEDMLEGMLFTDKFDVECMALCDHHPFCRAFKYFFSKRECQLYKAQEGEIETGQGEEGVDVFINVHAFLDVVSFVGAPLKEQVTLYDVSYSQCAAICTNHDMCKAFTHTDNYRIEFSTAVATPRRLLGDVTISSTPTHAIMKVARIRDESNTDLVMQATSVSSDSSGDYDVYLEKSLSHPAEARLIIKRNKICLKKESSLSGITPSRLGSCESNDYLSISDDVDGYTTVKDGLFCLGFKTVQLESVQDISWVQCNAAEYTTKFMWSSKKFILAEKDGFKPENPLCMTVSGAPKWEGCPTHSDSSLVYNYQDLHLYKKEIASDSLLCLSSIEPLSFVDCSSLSASQGRYRFDNFGRIVEETSGKCITAVEATSSIALDVCDDSLVQTFESLARCELRAIEETEVGLLSQNHGNNPIWAKNPSGIVTLDDTTLLNPAYTAQASTALLLQYNYTKGIISIRGYYRYNDGSTFLETNENICLNRAHGNDIDTIPDETPLTVGACDDEFRSQWRIHGENFDVLSLPVDFANIAGKDYILCRKSPGDSIALRSDATCGDLDRLWLLDSYGNLGRRDRDGREYAIKPTAIPEPEIDPELLYQIWLNSKFGRQTRSMIAKLAKLSKLVDKTERQVENIQDLSTSTNEFLGEVTEPIDKTSGITKKAASTAKLLNDILFFGTRLPYVGPVVKIFRKILGFGAKILKKSGQVLDKGGDLVDRLTFPIEQFDSGLDSVLNVIRTPVPVLEIVSEYLTSRSVCSFLNGNYYDVTQIEKIIRGLMNGMDIATKALDSLTKVGTALNTVKRKLDSKIKKPIVKTLKALKPVTDVLGALDFLRVIWEYDITLKVPVFEKKCVKPKRVEKKCIKIFGKRICTPAFTIPGFCYPAAKLVKKSFSLQDIGNFIKKIIDAVKSIPLIGEAIELMESTLDTIIEAIFGAIDLPLPGANLDFGFISDLEEAVTDAKETIAEKADILDNLIGAEDFLEKFGFDVDKVLDVLDGVPFDVDDVDVSDIVAGMEAPLNAVMGCRDQDSGCFPDLGDISLPTGPLGDIGLKMEAILDRIESLPSAINATNLLTQVTGCNRYETLDVTESLSSLNLGDELTEQLGCIDPIEFCVEPVLSVDAQVAVTNFEDELEAISDEFLDFFGDNDNNRRFLRRKLGGGFDLHMPALDVPFFKSDLFTLSQNSGKFQILKISKLMEYLHKKSPEKFENPGALPYYSMFIFGLRPKVKMAFGVGKRGFKMALDVGVDFQFSVPRSAAGSITLVFNTLLSNLEEIQSLINDLQFLKDEKVKREAGLKYFIATQKSSINYYSNIIDDLTKVYNEVDLFSNWDRRAGFDVAKFIHSVIKEEHDLKSDYYKKRYPKYRQKFRKVYDVMGDLLKEMAKVAKVAQSAIKDFNKFHNNPQFWKDEFKRESAGKLGFFGKLKEGFNTKKWSIPIPVNSFEHTKFKWGFGFSNAFELGVKFSFPAPMLRDGPHLKSVNLEMSSFRKWRHAIQALQDGNPASSAAMFLFGRIRSGDQDLKLAAKGKVPNYVNFNVFTAYEITIVDTLDQSGTPTTPTNSTPTIAPTATPSTTPTTTPTASPTVNSSLTG